MKPTITVDYGGCPVEVENPSPEVLAERERCAKVAEKPRPEHYDETAQARGRRIADDIRNGR